MDDRTEPDQSACDADRTPGADEEAAADEARENMTKAERERVAEHEQEMNRIGAETKGEGAVP